MTRRRRVGVDVDGVLADHVTALIPRMRAKYGIELRWEEATQWRLPLGDSDIVVEFLEAMTDLEWVAGIPAYPDAAGAIRELASLAEVVIVTARPRAAADTTINWLNRHGLPFYEFVCGIDADKNRQGLDLLIDDYLGNILGFLAEGADIGAGVGTGVEGRIGVLLDRPWNREGRDELFTASGLDRFHVVRSLREVTALLQQRS